MGAQGAAPRALPVPDPRAGVGGFGRGGRSYITADLSLEAATYRPTENVLTDENGDFDYMMGSSKQPYWQDENGNYRAAVYGVEDYPLEKLMRDAKILQIYDGTNQTQRSAVAGQPPKTYH